MKTFRLSLFVVILLIISDKSWAYDVEINGIYYKLYRIKENVTAVVTDGHNKYKGHVEIPNEILYKGEMYRVSTIGPQAFEDCTGLTSVTIPSSVNTISNGAFNGCIGLSSITIPNSVHFIAAGAFSGCRNLLSMTIPDSVTFVGKYAFNETAWYNNQPDGMIYVGKVAYIYKGEMPAKTSITIRDGIVSISRGAFLDCIGLVSVSLPNSLTYIGDFAFAGCSSLTSVTIPNSVTSIGEFAFAGCSSLTSVTIPNSVIFIDHRAFSETAWYNNQPDGMVYAGKVAYGYKGTMPANTSVIIKDGTVSISPYAFQSCEGLSSVTIPNSVTSIGKLAFQYCSSLNSVIIPNGMTTINDNSFEDCSGLTSVTIPNSVTSIGRMAFYHCRNLTSVTIPNSVISIGSMAFSGCRDLTSLIIPNSVTSIDGWAFSGCSRLTSIVVPNSVISLHDNAFDKSVKIFRTNGYKKDTPSLSSFEWLAFSPSTKNSKYDLKVEVKSSSQIEQERVLLNGNVIENNERGFAPAKEDEYGHTLTKSLTLVEGDNTIKVEVKNASGWASSEKTITYQPEKPQPAIKMEKRIALVVGNARYHDADKRLKNPVNDATDIADKLESLGFTVIRSLNQTKQELETSINDFGMKAKNYDIALFYYSGHGISCDGANYLVPVDANLPQESYVQYNCTNANLVLDLMERANCGMKILILDACRNNPFAKSWGKGLNDGGLNTMSAPKGSFIAFAAAPGEKAIDGLGEKNSPYTTALLQCLDEPGLNITELFDKVMEKVADATHEMQMPWYSKSSRGKFIFNVKQ